MQISDVIADMLTRIRNANNAKHETVDVPASNQKDGVQIRQIATENNVSLFTALDTVRVLLDVLEETTLTISTIDA